jgi:tetratricopeptide (TPR) repeat protein
MATLDNLTLHPLQTITPDLDWLEQEQRKTPTDIRLAHDIGLAHYWTAKSSGDVGVCVQHWQYVIVNWAMVLRSEFFWQGWASERSQAYKQTITIEQREKAREELENRLLAELGEFDTQHVQNKPSLKLLYVLENKSIISLRKTQGFQLAGLPGENMYCGPLMARYSGVQSAVRNFFAGQRSGPQREKQVSLHFILSSIKGYAAKQEFPSDLNFILRLCYSSLALAWVCMEQGNPQVAMELLAGLHCPNCHPEFGAAEGFAPLERCRDDCVRFAEANPSYASIQNGLDLFVRDAAELNARAHLLWSEQCLGSSDASMLLSHLRQALKATQKLEMQESLREQIGKLLLGWAREPEQDKRWNEVIALLKDAGEFDTSGTSLSKLALAYDQRGVERFKAGELEEGCADLRQAHALTPHVERIKNSLLNALRDYEFTARREKNDSLGNRLKEEIKRLEEGGMPVVKPVDGGESKKASPPPPPVMSMELPMSSLVHTELFDRDGNLDWDQFAPDAELIIRSACQRAVDRKEMVVDLPALILALSKESQSVRDILEAQGFSLGNPQIFLHLNKQMPEQEEANPRLQALKPSQFDLWITVVDILVKAWEKARQENCKITEAHILYGMDTSERCRPWLERMGLRLNTR